ncbi:hypothetical protein [Hydrogenophaga sp.]|jgi:hypothetical protein|uniref:hypothetical protein n=1 Tax=Hydrogenophaga sp. TaxID=1904254 RepID=UPI002736A3DC|nr:hypothetical protein [Hydrogenophaga sp.]MDP3887010.1 hypothetical protein [Hydrogenophaga sp.]
MVSVIISPIFNASDAEFGGADTLHGVVKRRVGGVDVPQYARITLLRLPDKKLARQTWSDASSGAFSFPRIEVERSRYIALAEFPANPGDPSEEDYLRPVAGVSLLRGEA